MSDAAMGLPLPPVAAEGELAFPQLLALGLSGLHCAGGGAEKDAAAIATASRLVGEAILDGHIRLVLADLPPTVDGAALQAALRRSPVVGTDVGAGAHPLVLADGALYLARYRDYEQRFQAVLQRLNRPSTSIDAAALRTELDRQFVATTGTQQPDWQKVAAATGVLRQLCVISGGPGTGKTTTVVRILAILLTLNPRLNIAIAAPTGKAAARVQESIRLQLAAMNLPAAVAAGLPRQSHTIHRLLGYRSGQTQFRHGRENRLPYDVVVVDEASMLDLALGAKLAEALKDDARLILLGDKDQLSSVEAGAVYAGVSSGRAVTAPWAQRLAAATGQAVPVVLAEAAPLADAVVWLEHSYRFAGDSALGRLARAINGSDAPAAIAILRSGAAELGWTEALPSPAVVVEELLQGYEPFIAAVRDARPAAEVFAAFDQFRVLCSTREGRYGSQRMAAMLLEALRLRLGRGHVDRWFVGRPVLVTRNDYDSKLFNGDVGIVLPDESGHALVHFPATDGGMRALSPMRLGHVEDALAVTVHRAQGSEFERVALVIEPQALRGLSRSLMYTGVTRARKGLRLYSQASALATVLEASNN